MTLIEALTILTAGNHGEINYHANDETRAAFDKARRVIKESAEKFINHHLITASGTAEFNSDEWYAAYHKERTWPFR